MAVNAKAFLAIEESLATRLQQSWQRISVELQKKLEVLVSRGDYAGAYKLAQDIDISPVIRDNLPYIKYATYAALFFGASRLTEKAKQTIIATGQWDGFVDQVTDSIKRSIELNVVDQIQTAIETELQGFEEQEKNQVLALKTDFSNRLRGKTTPKSRGGSFKKRGTTPLSFGTNKAAAHKWGLAQSKPALDAMRGNEDIAEYREFPDVNDFLRYGKSRLRRPQSAVDSLDKAIELAGPLKESVIVYREVGTNHIPAVGDTYTDPGFQSTTLDSSVSGIAPIGSEMMEITLPVGARGVYAEGFGFAGDWERDDEGEISEPPLSQNVASEFIIARGQTVRITGKKTVNGRTIHTAELVLEDPIKKTEKKPSFLQRIANVLLGHKKTKPLDITAFPMIAKEGNVIAGERIAKAERIAHEFVSYSRTGDSMLQLIAGLHTSRVSAMGFVAEAEVLGVDEYAVSEQLDNRICPVCYEMHGKRFSVSDARNALDTIFAAESPDDLRTLHPWPKQDRASLQRFRKLSKKQLVDNNWHLPPYHPGCRGILVHVGKVPQLADIPSIRAAFDKEPEVIQTAEDFAAYGVKATLGDIQAWNQYIGIPVKQFLALLTNKNPLDLLRLVEKKGLPTMSVRFNRGKVPSLTIVSSLDSALIGMEFNVMESTVLLTNAPAKITKETIKKWVDLWKSFGVSYYQVEAPLSQAAEAALQLAAQAEGIYLR